MPAVATSNGGVIGHVTSTSRGTADYTLHEQAQFIADSFGEAARDIVIALARELNVSLADACELAKAADSSFQAACAAHLVELRSQAQRDREQRQRLQEAADRRGQIASLEDAVSNITVLIEGHETRRRMILMNLRAVSVPEDARAANIKAAVVSLDLELAELASMLERAVAGRDAWNVAELARVEAEAAPLTKHVEAEAAKPKRR